ncbi:MAG: hypothetical protein ABIN99_13020, partial [Nitrosospira sp.]
RFASASKAANPKLRMAKVNRVNIFFMKVSKDRVEAESIALSIHPDGGQFHERNQFLAREQFVQCCPIVRYANTQS